MLRARHLDDQATALQRQGELALWIPLRGQEAAQVGSVRAALTSDFVFPSYREHAVAWERGLPAVEVLRLLRGSTHGGWNPADHNLANYALVLATQTLHAVGYALGVQLDAQRARADAASGGPEAAGNSIVGRPRILGDDAANAGGGELLGRPTIEEERRAAGHPDELVGRPTNIRERATVGRPTNTEDDPGAAVLVYLGDGAMSQGDANEAFVWAASFAAPVVFFCTNNQWAISTPASRQSRVPLADRASGFGFPGVRVDGNDVVAVHSVTSWALERARRGDGPTLIEAYTYRMGPHTTSDDPARYRPAEQEAVWRARDPIDRVARLLASDRDDAWFAAQRAEAEQAAARLREAVLALPEPRPDAFFDDVLVTETDEARAERARFRAYQESFQA
ncbi:thiamine pyrophosphate-dependent dehydrogenase E1 component subunit alpha [Frankia sp. AgB1.9]|nr:thiamine pyrophosphate-dependent dehydrogenase E1 component subunit alpha [Frankia sp. AgW1.1]MBL7548299.1 thiamine pyrophosphate-dependent dehydrogenase E1 component subunit alpha [Frankia sp. AgB1.9]MBL7618854.1 thiamine pyrophosphate-dependent dehydrogenase E1 component subunit alpha [Frankia sp. AgB1.8]